MYKPSDIADIRDGICDTFLSDDLLYFYHFLRLICSAYAEHIMKSDLDDVTLPIDESMTMVAKHFLKGRSNLSAIQDLLDGLVPSLEALDNLYDELAEDQGVPEGINPHLLLAIMQNAPSNEVLTGLMSAAGHSTFSNEIEEVEVINVYNGAVSNKLVSTEDIDHLKSLGVPLDIAKPPKKGRRGKETSLLADYGGFFYIFEPITADDLNVLFGP